MVEDKMDSRFFWVGVFACSNRAYHINFILNFYFTGLMAEWLKRCTVNTFFRGSIPLETLNIKLKYFK